MAQQREEFEDPPTIEGAAVTAQATTVVMPGEATPDLQLKTHPNGDGLVAVVRDGYEVKHFVGPKRARRVHRFDDLATFAAWLTREDKPFADILVGEDRVVARLEPASPISDQVECKLVKHPTFDAWAQAFQPQLPQRAFQQLVRGHRESLGAAGDVLAAALAQLSVSAGADLSSHIDELGATRIIGAGEKINLNVKLPPQFTVTTPVFEGVERDGAEATYLLQVFLSIEFAERRAPLFKLDCPGLALVVRQARRDAVAYLQGLLGEDYLVGVGALETAEAPAGDREFAVFTRAAAQAG